MKYALSTDQTNIAYEVSGDDPVALLFVHGWMGNSSWWNAQKEYFSKKFSVIQMDLPGHGKSEPLKGGYSFSKYASAIKAVAENFSSKEIILIGHSMSGAYVLEAVQSLPQVKALIVIDTLKDLDQIFTHEQAEKLLYENYRKDFKYAVENLLPAYLFTDTTPPEVRTRLQNEFLSNDVETAIELLEPLYKVDPRIFAGQITVPVRAINSEFIPTNEENNKKYFRDYAVESISGTGHYPMLERPEEFNKILDKVLGQLFKNAN